MATFEPVTANATINLEQSGEENISVSPTKIVYESDRYSAASSLEVHGIADADDEVVSGFPESESLEVGLLCEINETLIGAGTLSQSSVDEEGIWTGASFGAARKLQKSTVTRSKGGSIIEALDDIFSAADIPRGLDEPDIDGPPKYVLENRDYIQEAVNGERGPQLLTIYRNMRGFQQETCVDALEKLLQDLNWNWWVDEGNIVRIAPGLDSVEHDLVYVLETTAGKQTPPFQQVEVIGDNTPTADDPAAEPGTDSTEYLICKDDPIRATAGDGRPVYTYTDEAITTEAKAEAAAESILEEFLKQQAGGSITIIGNENIRPLDVVRLPDLLGGESYLVSSVTHEADNSNGFTTEIACGGLIDAGPGGDLNEEMVGEEVVVNDEGPMVEESNEGSGTAGSGSGTVQGPSGGGMG